ncbi:hypothetical protein QL285_085605 [Trifolium repens]|nr:hypothetical protein QL285_085605 [Trifolium repens]
MLFSSCRLYLFLLVYAISCSFKYKFVITDWVVVVKANGAIAKTSELSSLGMEIEIAELVYGLMTSKKEKIQKKIRNKEEKEQEVAMSLIMLSRDVRPWCGINSIAEFSDNNNHDDNDDNSLELESPLTHLVSKIEEKKRVISNGSEFVKVTKRPTKLDFSNIVSSKGKILEIFADENLTLCSIISGEHHNIEVSQVTFNNVPRVAELIYKESGLVHTRYVNLLLL